MLCGNLSRLLMVTLVQCNSESDFDAVASTRDHSLCVVMSLILRASLESFMQVGQAVVIGKFEV